MKNKKLVVLDNGKKFALLKETELDGVKYYFAAGVTDDETEGNGIYCYFRETLTEGRKYLEEVVDASIIKALKLEEKDFE